MKRKMQCGIILLALLGLPGSAPAAKRPAAAWVGSWAAAPMNFKGKGGEPLLADSTYRNVVHISVGGDELRVKLTNEFGAQPLKIGAAHVAVSAAGALNDGAIQPGTDRVLTFGGRSTVTIPEGAMVLSDPVEIQVSPASSLDISVYLPAQPLPSGTCHVKAWSTNFVSPGDTTGANTEQDARRMDSWCFVKGVDVKAGARAAAIVAFGDSITDGGHSTPDANHRWPDFLAERLLAEKKMAPRGVLNEGIGGNRILGGGNSNPNALARFDRDVLAQSGVKYLLILEGINDLGRLAKLKDPSEGASAEDLIFGLTQEAERAHQHGIKVFGATLTPYEGAGYFSPAGEQARQAVNHWIRTTNVLDGFVDFDKAVRDPANPQRFLPAYDHGDHLHPSDAGYKAMADAIDLAWFR